LIEKKIPFNFILDLLAPLFLGEGTDGGVSVKPMFGCHAIYLQDKILLAVRKKADHIDSNGVWIATRKEHHKSLKREFPSMRSIHILNNGKGETGWQMIPQDATDFEEAVIKVCTMILNKDERIGKIPNKKRQKPSTIKKV
jgi:hypothetical protein